MRILAIDPGPERSAWLWWAGNDWGFGIDRNEDMHEWLGRYDADVAVIEEVVSYGMPVGREVFQTVRWSGRFEQALEGTPVVYLPRLDVKMHLCHSPKAKDSNIRQALLDRFGKDATKGIAKDVWSALAIAVTYSDLNVPAGSAGRESNVTEQEANDANPA